MKKTLVMAATLAAAGSAHARDQVIKLGADDAAQLQGRSVAVTSHERPSFVAMTAGKASFGLFGAAAMVGAGNKLVDENHVEDPAILVREQLATALSSAFGARLAPADTQPTKAQKPRDLAALHPESDYVLDVRSGGWNFAYYPTKWATYWVGYSVQVQLIDAKTGRQVANAACNANTRENVNPPSNDELVSNGAQLLKDVTAGLGWTCVQLLAREEFNMPADRVAATPVALVDPLAARKQPTTTLPAAAPSANAAGGTGATPAPDAPGTAATSAGG
ncbi:hypothetical protein [Cognatilysobacter lacus]|uniref:Uncharacterized protein n=1 Tax=Cognatilysobacter lacus TaxID=1643323 RepID=A0A5D8Z7P0_9GAMM|nr:hypothetical protein [Lysobacter lacus]TZF90918.1 hypothetical protein FW784_03425 [Lysobacter lacus]